MISEWFRNHPLADWVGKAVSGSSLSAGLVEKFTIANVNDVLLFIGLAASTTYSVLKVIGWFDERRERKRKNKESP